MPWKETDTMSQRGAFIEQLISNRCTMSEACERFGISRPHPDRGDDRAERVRPGTLVGILRTSPASQIRSKGNGGSIREEA